jgi:glyoxylate/hydroxypyruvate reductase A
MSIAIVVPDRNLDVFLSTFQQWVDEAVQVYPNIERKEDVDVLIAWNQPEGYFDEFPNLQLVCSFGAGVDHITNDPSYKPDFAITRVVDKALSADMSRYILAAVSMYQYGFPFHFDKNLKHDFLTKKTHRPNLTVGIMGLGQLGTPAATMCARSGYEVIGWSKSKKEIEGVTTFAEAELEEFLSETNILVCMLPLTASTKDFIGKDIFNQLKAPAFFINVGRGQQVVEENLIRAITDEVLMGACLDVIRNEPISSEEPMLNNERIIITPHIASITNQENCALQIAENIKRFRTGKALLHQVKPEIGY